MPALAAAAVHIAPLQLAPALASCVPRTAQRPRSCRRWLGWTAHLLLADIGAPLMLGFTGPRPMC
jgi:hypothetical protein